MDQNSNNSKVSVILIIYLIIMLLIPPVTILIILLTKYIRQKIRIKNSKETRMLSLENISSSFAIDELFNFEKSKNFYYVSNSRYNKKCIKFDFSKFLDLKCKKEYFFTDDKFYMCTYQMKCNSTEPKQIFRELVKVNEYPDEIHFDRKTAYLECVWHGINGVIYFNRFINNMVEIIFELNE